MSADDQAGAGRREVAYRVFAAEYDDADFGYTENEADERAPNYVVTPTGARVNRLFAVGVLTEVERVNEEMLRGRVVDPTGAFVVYAGQYQPDALTALERAEPPTFVAVTGKARTFQPEDADVIYTSIRPESINEVDAEARDRWTVEAARHTIDRVATFLDAMDAEERGDELEAALEAEGVDSGLVAGIPLAIEHYGTTTAYLDAVRVMAVQAAEVVAGDRDEVEPLDVAPDEGGEVDVPVDSEASLVAAGIEGEASATASGTATGATADETANPPGATSDPETTGVTADESDMGTTAEGGTVEEASGTDETRGVDGTATPGADAGDGTAGTGVDDLGDFDAGGGASAEDSTATGDDEPEEPAAAADEMYEFEDGEREEIEEEFGTEFSTGTEIEEPGEADLDTPASEGTDATAEGTATEDSEEATAGAADEPAPDVPGGSASDAVDELAADDVDGPATDATDDPAADTVEEATAGTDAGSDATEPEAEPEDATASDTEEVPEDDEAPEDVDLEEAVVEAMRELDDGDGAERAAVVESVSETYGANEDEVADAIQDALMSGTCYEPGDGLLKAI